MTKAGRVQHWKHGWIPLDAFARASLNRQSPSSDQLAALQPRRGGWTTSTRARTVPVLKATPSGRRLLDAIDHYQNASKSSAIPRMRTDISTHLAGGSLPQGRHETIQALLDAIDASPGPSDRPLLRGMVIPGTPDAVLAHYAPGTVEQVPLASFTSDPKIATDYSVKGAGQRVRGAVHTPVIIEWTGAKKALPIENLAPSRVFAEEREWLTSGRFTVQASRMARRGGRSVVLVQVGQG